MAGDYRPSHDIAMTQAHRERSKVCIGPCPIEFNRMFDGYECHRCSWFGYDEEEALALFKKPEGARLKIYGGSG